MTYYFQPDANLRSAYGGGAVYENTSSQDTTKSDMTQRHITKTLGVNKAGAEFLLRRGTTSSGTVPWLYFEDADHSIIQPLLSTAENATLTATTPAGFAAESGTPKFSLSSYKRNIITIGDSITAGMGYGATTFSDTFQWKMLPLLTGYAGTRVNVNDNSGPKDCTTFRLYNHGIGSSNFNNTEPPNNDYDHVWYQRRAQQLFTMVLPSHLPTIMTVWLGTNDIAYDGTVTAAACWARAVEFHDAVRTALPSNLKLIMVTALKRGDSVSGNNPVLNDYNDLIRANAVSEGFDAIADVERLTVDNSGTYYSAPYYPYKIIDDEFGNKGTVVDANYTNGADGVHPSAYGYGLIAPVFANAINSVL
jgi:lysophospholipase L1-like esterase